MPVRNIVTILLALIISLICYFTSSRNRYANTLAEAMTVVEEHALVNVPRRKLFKSAMNGMLQTLDPNSMFLADDDRQQMEEDINQEFAGVGLRIQVPPDTQQLTIVRPMLNTPAQRAGLLAGDVILKIDGKSTANLDTTRASTLMRGPVGEPVTLTIERDLVDPFDVKILRERIQVPSVTGDTQKESGTWNFFLESNPTIAYIRLDRFGEHSVEELEAAFGQIKGKTGLILDLRSNLGGLLDAAVDICDMFLPEDQLIVATKGREQKILSSFYSTKKQIVNPDMPVVILINRRSASASEILAACLQDHGRALVIGERSYGKGTVQDLIQIEEGRSYLKLTVASYWRPSNRNIDRTLWDEQETENKGEGEWGVQPNEGYACEMSIDQVNQIEIARFMRDNDPQRKDLDDPLNADLPVNDTDATDLEAVDDSKPENSAEAHGGEATDSETNGEQDTADEAPKLREKIPRWESIDTPVKKAIEYLEKLTKSKAAA